MGNFTNVSQRLNRAAIVLLWFSLAFSISNISAASDSTLMRVTIASDNPQVEARHYRTKGFDVLEGSVTKASFDLVLSEQEFDSLQDQTLKVVQIERGRPLSEVVPMNTASRAIPNGYFDLAGINQRMVDIANAFPNITSLVNITQTYGQAQTFEGRDIFALKISDNVNVEENEPAIMIVSNHHAREIVTPVIALDAMDRLTQGYGTDTDITNAIDTYEIWIAANWNPDGYNEVIVGDNLWRKNRRPVGVNFGIDQNRNYPQGWSSPCGGSTFPSSQTYRGASPASEPETQTMIAWSQDQDFAKVIDYHSYGEEVLYGYSCTSHPFTNYYLGEAIDLSTASGYFGVNRPAGAEGEHYQWQLAQQGSWSHLIETHSTFQPSFASAQTESNRVWPGILHAIQRPIPLSGQITDAVTGAPLEADIELAGVAFTGGETNQSGGPFGRYHVFAPAGNFEMIITAPGYLTEAVNVDIVTGQALVVDIPMFISGPDGDSDGIADSQDNCTTVSNSSQVDTDGDGFGNGCDADTDNNCVINFLDVGAFSNAFLSNDPLHDFNEDGDVNFLDYPTVVDNIFQEPGPSALASCSL